MLKKFKLWIHQCFLKKKLPDRRTFMSFSASCCQNGLQLCIKHFLWNQVLSTSYVDLKLKFADDCGISRWYSSVQHFLPRPAPVLCITRCDSLLPHFCSHLVQVNHLQWREANINIHEKVHHMLHHNAGTGLHNKTNIYISSLINDNM